MSATPYKVKVTPTSASDTAFLAGRALYTVSLGTPTTTSDALVNGYVWASARFPNVAILLGDSLYRLTIQIQTGKPEGDALLEAESAAAATMSSMLRRMSTPGQFIRTTGMATSPEYYRVLEVIEQAFATEPRFAASVASDAATFVHRQAARHRLALGRDQAEALARRYVQEEIAAYSLLASHGWRVDVYLGEELPTLSGLITGSLPPITHDLASRISIALLPKRRR